MDNDCIFKIPPRICDKLGIEDERDEFKQYMVTDKGELYLPWRGLYKLGFWGVPYDGMIECSLILEELHGDEREDCEQMITDLINYHESKFDNHKGIA